MDRSQKRQIRNLLIILTSGLLAAFLFAALLLRNYGPTGRYDFKSTLLEPELVEGLSFDDNNSKTGGMSRYIFGDIEFATYNSQENQWKHTPVTLEQYASFYQAIGTTKSVPEDDLASQFSNSPKLIVYVKTESDASWQEQKKSFQEVQFSKDYLRVQLREDNRGSNWAYFYMPSILERVKSNFN